MSERTYRDMEGNPCTLLQLVKKEPEWAASRIRAGEEIADLTADQVRVLREALERVIDDGLHFQLSELDMSVESARAALAQTEPEPSE